MLKLYLKVYIKCIKRIFILILLKLLIVIGLKSEDYSYLLKGPLAGSLYYTAEKPGRWKELIESHTPIITKNKNKIEVITNHEMRGVEHYIIKHVVFDKEFKIISEVKFKPSISIPSSSHNISGYSGEVFVLSICNQHDNWLNFISLDKIN